MVSKTIDSCSNQDAPAMKISKSKFFLGIPIALISLELYLGILLGYFLAKLSEGKVPSVVFKIGDWKLHLHHWFLGAGILISALCHNFLPIAPFSYGILGGLIVQGISCYPDWYRIVVRRKNTQ